MEGNTPPNNIATSPPQDSSARLKIIETVGLVVVILALLGGIFFFDQIKSAFTPSKAGPTTPTAQKTLTSPTPFPTIDPRVVCARFTDLKDALFNIEKACGLDLSNQNLTSLPKDVLRLKKLNTIILNNNEFTKFPEELTSMATLIEIDLSNNKISAIPQILSKLENLQKIDLSNNKIQTFPSEVIIPQLNDLILIGNNFSTEEKNKIKEMFPRTEISF